MFSKVHIVLSLFLPTKTNSPVLKSVAPNDGFLLRDCVIITWGGGVGKFEGGIGENDNKREGRLQVKFNTYGWGELLFHSFLQTGKVVEEILEFKYKY